MTLKYEILKRLVKAVNIKKMWTGMSTEELLENKRKQNAKNRIPDLKDEAFDISRIEIMGCPVLKLIHKKKANKANLFLIGGGMISAPRPGSVKKALRFAKETGVDVFVPYYPLCTDYPLTKAYEMIQETYRVMLRDYDSENISVLGTSSGGNLALGMVPYINDGHGDTPMPGYIMAISPGTCVDTDKGCRDPGAVYENRGGDHAAWGRKRSGIYDLAAEGRLHKLPEDDLHLRQRRDALRLCAIL